MIIPKGFRLVGDDEIITKDCMRWHREWDDTKGHKPLTVLPKQIGKTKLELRKLDQVTNDRLFVKPIGQYPEFDGWVAIGDETPTLPGDVAVLIKKPRPTGYSDYNTPEVGLHIDHIVPQSMKGYYTSDKLVQAGGFCVYRRTGEEPRKNRLPPNPARLTAPLPLP